MQLTKTIFSDSAIFIEKKTVENRCWQKVNFCGQKSIMAFNDSESACVWPRPFNPRLTFGFYLTLTPNMNFATCHSICGAHTCF